MFLFQSAVEKAKVYKFQKTESESCKSRDGNRGLLCFKWRWAGVIGLCLSINSSPRTRSSHAANMSHLDWNTIIISHTVSALKWTLDR